eukprot:1502908-Pleurochrysis_carterae.AAC.2
MEAAEPERRRNTLQYKCLSTRTRTFFDVGIPLQTACEIEPEKQLLSDASGDTAKVHDELACRSHRGRIEIASGSRRDRIEIAARCAGDGAT